MDIVVISHNHYDHMDVATLKELEKLYQPHVFAPLNNGAWFKSIGWPEERTHILDWWDGRDVKLALSSAGENKVETTFTVTCTPAQHFTGRGLHDRFHTLWASWAVTTTEGSGYKAWFGGDTGYRSVYDGEDEDSRPVCPEFKKIGDKFGGFDLAFIPIGYARATMRQVAVS